MACDVEGAGVERRLDGRRAHGRGQFRSAWRGALPSNDDSGAQRNRTTSGVRRAATRGPGRPDRRATCRAAERSATRRRRAEPRDSGDARLPWPAVPPGTSAATPRRAVRTREVNGPRPAPDRRGDAGATIRSACGRCSSAEETAGAGGNAVDPAGLPSSRRRAGGCTPGALVATWHMCLGTRGTCRSRRYRARRARRRSAPPASSTATPGRRRSPCG